MVSKAKIRAQTKYEAKVYDKVLLRIKKDSDLNREAITEAATAVGQSMNEYILEAIRRRVETEKTSEK